MSMPSIVPGRVSIIIPAYNSAATIAATVESCLAQTYKNVEIIVVNDGSSDDTSAVLRKFGEKITAFHGRNGGVAASRNAGVRFARGEYHVWMDHDDIMAPQRIQLQVVALEYDPSVGLVSSDFSAFTTENVDFESSHIATYYSALHRLGGLGNVYTQSRVMTPSGESAATPITVRSGWIYESLLSGNFVHPPTVMVRRSVCDRVGEFDESMTYNSEYDFIVRLAKLTPIAYIDAALLRYRRSETQLSHGGGAGKVALETIRVLEKIRVSDPDIYSRQRPLFQHRLALQFINAADLIGPSDRLRAFGLLIRGLRHKVLFGAALHAFARIVTPRIVVRMAKRMLHTLVKLFA